MDKNVQENIKKHRGIMCPFSKQKKATNKKYKIIIFNLNTLIIYCCII